jgi:hypothetical protein
VEPNHRLYPTPFLSEKRTPFFQNVFLSERLSFRKRTLFALANERAGCEGTGRSLFRRKRKELDATRLGGVVYLLFSLEKIKEHAGLGSRRQEGRRMQEVFVTGNTKDLGATNR